MRDSSPSFSFLYLPNKNHDPLSCIFVLNPPSFSSTLYPTSSFISYIIYSSSSNSYPSSTFVFSPSSLFSISVVYPISVSHLPFFFHPPSLIHYYPSPNPALHPLFIIISSFCLMTSFSAPSDLLFDSQLLHCWNLFLFLSIPERIHWALGSKTVLDLSELPPHQSQWEYPP